MLRLFDTATGQVRPLELRDPGAVSIYLCGPTVYDLPHLGHGRHALVWDVLRRYLEWTGLDVRFVSNITDVDDNIIRRAEQEGRTEGAVAAEFEGAWYDALDALGVQRPTADPHATAYVPQMVELVAELVARGVAYELEDGVYLDTGRGARATGCWPASRSTPSGRGPGWRSTSTSARPSTSCCGRRPSPASRRGPRPGARAGRGGTPSAW